MEEQKKIVVLCGGKFAFQALQLLAFEKFLCGVGIGKGDPNVVKVLSLESGKSGFGFQSFADKKSMSGMRAWLDELQPDYIFSVSFPFLIPEDVLAYGKEKFINFHPGPLPGYRGAKPIFEVLRYEETQTAVSVHYMSDGFDTGNIIFKDPVEIMPGETYGQLAVKLSTRTSQAVLNTANMLQFATTVPSVPQDESEARYFEKPAPMDTFIKWHEMSAGEIVALINACNPWNTGADTNLLNEQAKIISASLVDEPHNQHPGTILSFTGAETISVASVDNKQVTIALISTDAGIMTAKQFKDFKPGIIGLRFD